MQIRDAATLFSVQYLKYKYPQSRDFGIPDENKYDPIQGEFFRGIES